MISPVRALGAVEEPQMPTRPLTEDLRAAQLASSFLHTPQAIQPIPAVYVGGYSDTSSFVYNGTGHVSSAATPSVSVPGIGHVPGLTDYSYTASPLKYEIKVGGVLVARVYENGVMVAVEGFDFIRMGFPSEQERALSGSEIADSRTAKFGQFLTERGAQAQVLRAPAYEQSEVKVVVETRATPFGPVTEPAPALVRVPLTR